MPYQYFHWDEGGNGEHVKGIDEEDGWVRTERGFLPKEILGMCVLKPLVQAAPTPPFTIPTPVETTTVSFTRMFDLMIRICGGPGHTAMRLVDLVEEEFGLGNLTGVNIQDMRASAGAADASTEAEAPLLSEDAVESAIATVHECAHLICICLMDRLGRTEEFVAVVHRIIRCVVQVCLQLPPSICGKCSRRMIDLLLHKSVVLEASMQLWKLLTDAETMQPEWVYSSGVLAAEFVESLEQLLSENTEEDEVEFQLNSMVQGMKTLIHSVRFHLVWVEKAGMLKEGSVPFYAKLAMQGAVQESLPEVLGQSASSSLSTDTPGVSQIAEVSFQRHVEGWIQEGASSKNRDSDASGSGLRKKSSAAKRKAMVAKFRKWRGQDGETQLRSTRDEDFESQESEEIDSQSSQPADDDDMGLDLADFIDADPEQNNHGFIEMEELPRPSSKAPPHSSSPVGLRAYIDMVRATGGVRVDAETQKKMEAFLKIDVQSEWHKHVRHIFKMRSNSLSSDPVPRRQLCDGTETSS